MKRFSSSDSLGGLKHRCPDATDENNPMYSDEFQTMVEEDRCFEESGRVYEKKRRLRTDQVKALEKNFEDENKLEPERKLKLAQEIGLQPRQVAVWFQNRRARWKTEQLQRDYGVLKANYDGLKANYDGLKLNFERLQGDKESLLKQIHELKSKLDENIKLNIGGDAAEAEAENSNGGKKGEVWPKFGDSKDGSSDSDSSAILNDEIDGSPREVLTGSSSSYLSTNSRSFQLKGSHDCWSYQPQLVKIEEHNFFGEEPCATFFSDDQAPTLPWCCNDQWS